MILNSRQHASHFTAFGSNFACHKAVFYLDYIYEVAYGQFKDKMSVYMYTAYYKLNYTGA